jgi:hypothetical protein
LLVKQSFCHFNYQQIASSLTARAQTFSSFPLLTIRGTHTYVRASAMRQSNLAYPFRHRGWAVADVRGASWRMAGTEAFAL